MSAVRSGPFTWSSFGAGYVVASVDDGGSPIIDVVLPGSDDGPGGGGSLRWVAALQPDDAARLADELSSLTSQVSPLSAGTERPARWLMSDLRGRVDALDGALQDLAEAGLDGGTGGGGDVGAGAGAGVGRGAEAAIDAVDDLLRRLHELRGDLSGAIGTDLSAAARLAAGPADASTVMTGPGRAVAPDRRLTTMGGLALALGIVAVFWVALGVLLWIVLR